MKEFDETLERTNERPRRSKSAQRRPKSRRPRMSEDEDINFDASTSRLCENVLAGRSKN